MKIAYVHYLYGRFDGTRDRTRHFTDAIRELGHEVEVFGLNLAGTPGDPADAGGEKTLRARIRAALKRRFSRYLHEPKEILWNRRYGRREREVLSAYEPDVVVCRPTSLGISILKTTRKLDLPLVFEIHAPRAERKHLDRYTHIPFASRWMEEKRLREADAVTTVSTPLTEHLVDLYDIPREKFVVVPNGVELDRFHPGVAPDPEVRSRLGDGPVVGFVGSFQEWHGTGLLTRMIQRVAAARPEARFLLVGEGPTADEVRAAVEPLGERVLFLGWTAHERMPAITASLDVGVLPEADFYRCPLKLVEWMAAGCAVVVPRYAPLVELVEDGREGLFFAPGVEDQFTAAVDRLIAEREFARRLGAAASEKAHTSMSWQKSAEKASAACELARKNHARGKGP